MQTSWRLRWIAVVATSRNGGSFMTKPPAADAYVEGVTSTGRVLSSEAAGGRGAGKMRLRRIPKPKGRVDGTDGESGAGIDRGRVR